MSERTRLTSTEIGTLWMTYQQKTMLLRMLEYWIAKAADEEAKSIMEDIYNKISPLVEQIKTLFQEEGAAVPVGFSASDVHTQAPLLYDDCFDIICLRLMKEISMGMHTLHLSMSYRKDISQLYKDLCSITQECYMDCTEFLLKKGIYPRPPYFTMPNSVEFVQKKSYMSGLNLFGEKRSLNTVEVAHLYHSIEANRTGMQLIIGFAQTAKNKEVRNYFKTGKELAKSFVEDFSKVLLASDVQVPATPGGTVTKSTEAPFSDKLMMYCVSLLCSFSLGSNALGTAFSLRNDLSARVSIAAKDVFEYGHQGAKIMVKNGWMEEPPQMEDRNQLIK